MKLKGRPGFRSVVACVAALALLGSACAGGTEPEEQADDPGTENGEATKDQPVSELVVGRMTDINVPDPHVIGNQTWMLHDQVFDTLIRYVDGLEPQPGLATSWKFNDDSSALTLVLRDGVVFHSGKPLTSEDVAFTLERVQIPEVGAHQARTMSSWITSVEMPDDLTITLNFDQPRPYIMDMLSFLYIGDSSVLAAGDAADEVSGTGPFRFVDWQPGVQFVLERFEDHWQAGVPSVDRIVVKTVTDAQALAAQVRAGAIDIVEGLPAREVARLATESGFNVVTNNFGPEYLYLGMDVTQPPFDDQRVRQAMAYALDRERFLDSSLNGIGEATGSPWPPHSSASSAQLNEKYAFDLVEARRLLVEAGHETLSINLTTSTAWPELVEHAEMFQADLAKIGVTLSIETVEIGRWIDAVAVSHTAQIWTGGFGFSNYSPVSLFAMAAPWRPSANMQQFESEEYAGLVSAALSEPNAQRQLALVEGVTNFHLDQALAIPIVRRQLNMVEGPRATGAEYLVTGFSSLRRASMSK